MSQQLIVLKNRNDLLKTLIGRNFDQKLKDEAYEILMKIHKGYLGSPLKVLVYNVDTKTNKVLGIGGSSLLKNPETGKIISDLIPINFITFWNAFIGTVTGLDRNVFLEREPDVVFREYGIYNDSNPHRGYNQSLGGRINIGQSATAPTRTDVRLNSKFVTSPESAVKTVDNPNQGAVYTSATGKISPITANIQPTGGAGTIQETGLYLNATPVSGGTADSMFAHDVISPSVSFIAGQSITIEYTWQI